MLLAAICLTLRSMAAAPGDAEWSKLLSLISQETKPAVVRVAALKTACRHAAAENAGGLVEMATAWASELDASGLSADQISGNPAYGAKRELFSTLIGCSARINAVATDSTLALTLWKTAATRSWTAPQIKLYAFQAIVESPANAAQRRSVALSVLADSQGPQNARVLQLLLSLLDQDFLAALRTLVAQATSPADFNLVAAAALAHCGDAQIVEHLQTFRTAWSSDDPAIGQLLDWYLWQIDAQNPPSDLLGLVASSEPLTQRARAWALRRAIELDLPSVQIRNAVLQFADALPAEPVGEVLAELACVKRIGLDCEVLAETDIPNVTLETDGPDAVTESTALAGQVYRDSGNWHPTADALLGFVNWCSQKPCQGLNAAQTAQLLKQKLCELGIIKPSACGSQDQN